MREIERGINKTVTLVHINLRIDRNVRERKRGDFNQSTKTGTLPYSGERDGGVLKIEVERKWERASACAQWRSSHFQYRYWSITAVQSCCFQEVEQCLRIAFSLDDF